MGRPDRLIRSKLRSRYLVSTADGEAFDGILIDADDKHLILVQVVQVAINGQRLSIDGELWIQRDRVKYMQTITL